MTKIDFLNSAEYVLTTVKNHMDLALECKVRQSVIDLHNESIGNIITIMLIAKEQEVSENYLTQFQKNLNSIHGSMPYGVLSIQKNSIAADASTKSIIESHETHLEQKVKELKFNIDFFNKTGFLNKNIVAIGANGSGKTSLSNKFKEYMQGNGVVISAQRILLVPNFDHIQNPQSTLSTLRTYQTHNKTYKDQGEFGNLHAEFEVVLKNLIAQNNAEAYIYKVSSNRQHENKEEITPPKKSGLDRTIEIWNSLIEHRKMRCVDGMNIQIELKDEQFYPAIQMSDGEKVILFLIAQVLQAPLRGFIIIDEPEMYLHKTILKKMWDFLERERNDCIFIYLTHDLDFAASRITAKKIWVKSFDPPDKWELEQIPENELPEPLMLELLGSRKNILFCEGVKGSLDEKIFNITFPEYTVMPVDNCSSVISYTKAFNKLPNLTTRAVGIIDSDHHEPSKLKTMEKDKIFSFRMSECENLLLDEKFLLLAAEKLLKEPNIVENIKRDVLKFLEYDIEQQVANFVSAKINYYFRSSHVSKGNTLDSLTNNYNNFTKGIEIEKWYEERKKEVAEIIQRKDYKTAISLFNNKGLIAIVNRHLNITDFKERAITILQTDTNARKAIIDYFPKLNQYN